MAEPQSWDELVSKSASAAPAASSWDDLVAESKKDPGYVGEAIRGVKAGLKVQLPKMAGQALQFFGAEETGKQLVEGAEARNTPDLQESAVGQAHDSPWSVRGNIYEAATNAVPSLAPGAAGAAAGAALGSIIPGAGTAMGALMGYAVGSIAALPMFYGSQAKESYDAVKKAQLEEGKSEAEADSIATKTAHAEGTIEAGGEVLADIIPFAKLFKPVVRPVAKAAGTLIMDALVPTFKQGAKTAAGIVGAEVGTEMAQQAGEDYVRKEMGGTGEGATWHETSKVIMPTAIMSAIPGMAGAVARHIQRKAAVSALVDPDTDPETRSKIAMGVSAAIQEADPTLARNFAAYAARQIHNDEPIEIGKDTLYEGQQKLLPAPQPIVPGAPADNSADVAAAEANAAKVYGERNAHEARQALLTNIAQAQEAAEKTQEVLQAGTLDDAIEMAKDAISSINVPEQVANDMRLAHNGRMLLERMETQSQEEAAYAEREAQAVARDAELASLNEDDRTRTQRSLLADMVARGQGDGPIAMALKQALGLKETESAVAEPTAQPVQPVAQAPQAEAKQAEASAKIPTTPAEVQAATAEHLEAARNLTRSAETKALIGAEIARRAAMPKARTVMPETGTPASPPILSLEGNTAPTQEAVALEQPQSEAIVAQQPVPQEQPAATAIAAPSTAIADTRPATAPAPVAAPTEPAKLFGKPLTEATPSELRAALKLRLERVRVAAQQELDRRTVKVDPSEHEALRFAAKQDWFEKGGKAAGGQYEPGITTKSQQQLNEAGQGRTHWIGAPLHAGSGMTRTEVQAAVEKAIAGQPMGERQRNVVLGMLDKIREARVTPEEEAAAQRAADEAERLANADNWSKMTEEEQNAEADRFFGSDSRPESAAAQGAQTRAPVADGETSSEERQPGEDDEVDGPTQQNVRSIGEVGAPDAAIATTPDVAQGSERGAERTAGNEDREPGTDEEVAAPAAPGSFDSEAFDRRRREAIKASKQSGVRHLDDIRPAAVETMRGLKIYNVHDPKERGVVRTVANTGEVVINWSDEYSAKANLATEREEKVRGKSKPQKVFQTWLMPSDLKDYAVDDGRKPQRPSLELAAQTEQDLAAKEAQAQTGNAEERHAAVRDRDTAILSAPEGTAPPRDVAEQKVPTAQENLFSTAAGALREAADKIEKAATPQRIEDLGEKIGGARKDTSQPTGQRAAKAVDQDDSPAWRKRYIAMESIKRPGVWTLFDKRTERPLRDGWRPMEFASEESAERAIPLAAVAQKHRVVTDQKKGDGYTYKIIRDVTDRKRVTIKDGFASNDEAMRYMAEHAAEILETKTGFGEEILAVPEKVFRKGPERRQGDVKGEDFIRAFGFRGVEFGNWNNQTERQEVMNHAYDALLDLADILKIPAKALSLNGDLGLAFGARGQGLSGAKAHYERDYGVINLTKMSGAGALGHEWFHGFDHYLARQDTKSAGERVKDKNSGDLTYPAKSPLYDYASHGFSLRESKVREELRAAYTKLMETMFKKAEQYVEDTQQAAKFVGAARDALRHDLDSIRADLASQKDPQYWKRNNKPATAEQLAAFDMLADKLVNGENLGTQYKADPKAKSRWGTGRMTNDTLDAISAIYKQVRGRSGFSNEHQGVLDRVRAQMGLYAARLKMLADANTGAEKTKKVPTSYAMEAKKIDQGRASDYWTTPHEMAARAFSAFIEDKVAEREGRSDFLSFGSDNAFYRILGVRPFPEGAERKAINKAFDEFVDTLKTKETDQGTALFSRQAEESSVFTPDEVRAHIRDILFSWKNAPSVEIIKSMQDAPEEVRDADEGQKSGGAEGTPEGFYWNGKVYLVAEALGAKADVVRTLFHEALGHAGLRGVFGERLNGILDEIAKSAPERVKRKAEQYGLDVTNEEDRRTASEEVLAEIAQSRPELGIVRRAVAAIRQFLRELGIDLKLSDNDIIAQFILPARGFVERGTTESAPRLAPAFKRAAATTSEAFKRWFGDSKVVDENGDPLVVYHGTATDFDEFEHGHPSKKDGGWLGKGFYFTDQPDVANSYTNLKAGDKPNVMPVYLSMKNPAYKEGMSAKERLMFADLRGQTGKLSAETARLRANGHDGVIWKPGYPGAPMEFVVFDPAQIKSATGNRGTFDASNPDIRFSRAEHLGTLTADQEAALRNVHGDPQTWRTRLAALKKDWKKNLVQGIFDQYAPIMELSPQAYRLARVSKGGDSTLESMLMYAKVYVDKDGAYRSEYTKAGGFNGFAKVLSALHGEQDRFIEWVAALRAERLKSVGLENLYSDRDIAALKSLNQGAMKDGSNRGVAYAKALKELNEWNDSVLKIAADSGLIDEKTREMYRDVPYVPFYRLQDEGIVAGFGMKAGIVNQSAWKKLKGGTAHLNDDLLANVLQNWSHLITASAKNRAAKVTLEAAVRAKVAEEVPSGTPGKGLVGFRENGKERVFHVSDPHLMDAISAMEYAGLGSWSKPFTAMKRALTIGVTVNPAFKVRNLIRDSIQAIGTAELSYNPAKNIAQGAKAFAKDSETRANMLAAGGAIRFGSMLDGNNADRTRRLIEQGVKPEYILDDAGKVTRFWKERVVPAFEAYQEFGDRGEQISRAALYEQLLAKGMSHEEASFWARDLMDFGLMGKWTAVRTLAQVVPFFNARLQGLYKLGRATKADYKRMGATLGAVALSSIALLLAYGDDDDWKKREDWDRENFWWFKVGGIAFRIPKPFEIGAIGTLAERSAEYLISNEMTGKRFAERMSATVFNQLSMNPTPQLVKPLMDLYANKDSFTDRPIETMGMEKLRKQDRSTERTTELAKFLGSVGMPDPTKLVMGKWDTLSPVQIEALVRGYFGWLGTSTTVALDWGIRPMMDRGQRPDMQLRDVFLAGNFAETLPSNASRYVTRLYDQAQEIEQAFGSYRDALKRGDLERAQSIRESEADKLRQYGMVETIKRRESLLNEQARRIEASKDIPGDEKRRRLDLIAQRKNDLARALR